MSNTRILARITDQRVELVNVPLLASGSVGVLQIQCEFDSLWSGYGKTAVFYRTEDEVYHIPVASNLATVPQEVLADDGEFFFGIMGVSDNTRTTEVVRLQVKQGALTTSTAKPATPTPDIYQQLIATYGILEARFDQAIAMHGVGDATEHALSDEYIGGTIKTNGAVGYIEFTISKMSLVAGGNHYTDYCIPPEIAALCPVALESTNADLDITLEAANSSSGWSRILIENVGSGTYTTDMVTTVRGIYPLATIYVAELADLRVDVDGKTYTAAGEAVRDHMAKRPRLKGVPDAESFGHLTANLTTQGFYLVQKTDWADLPGEASDSSFALLVFWYTKNYNIQVVYSIPTDLVAYRIVNANTGKVYKDWFVQNSQDSGLGAETWLEDITDTLTITVGGLTVANGLINTARTQGRATELFPVKAGEVYHLWGAYNKIFALAALYDETKAYIGCLAGTDSQSVICVENESFTIPATVTDASGTQRNVAYMACGSAQVYQGGSGLSTMDLKVKKEVLKYNTSDDLVELARGEVINKQDKVLLSPNGGRWVLTISNDGTLTPIKMRAKAEEVDTTLTLPTTLGAGTYSLKYEDANGALPDYLDICSLEVATEGEAVSYTGLIAENCAPEGATALGVYDASGNRVAGLDLGFLGNKYSGKLYSFGAISDVHIGQADSVEDFTNAVAYFDAEEDIEFVAICGDMVDDGSNTSQLETYQSIANAAEKPIYVTSGNHEILSLVSSGKGYDDIKQYFIQDKYPWANKQAYYTFSQNDDVFIMFGITGSYVPNRAFTDEQLQWLHKQLETYRNKRCFVFMHYFPWDGSGDAVNCYGENGLQGSKGDVFQDLLKHYKNAIWFHGHSHAMFKVQELDAKNTIDRTYGRYSVHIPSLTWPTYPNDAMTGYVKYSAAGEGYIVDVYEHGIALRGRDFETGAFSPIGSYYLDTVLEEIPANSWTDGTGTIDTPI